MSEYIISGEALESIRRTCYEAGMTGRENFTCMCAGEEIVRCRDCGHCETEEVDYDMGEVRDELECYLTGLEVKPDGFCSRGKRR